MGHKSFTIALFLGLLSLPLACGSDDDSTSNGTSGAGGKGGASGAAGNAGKGGKGGNAGTAGTTPGVAGEGGEGGSGDTGNVAGDSAGGAGGDSNPSAGAGGEAGGGDVDPRLAQVTAICNYPAQPDGPEGTDPQMQCLGDASVCAANLYGIAAKSADCSQVLDDILACLPTAEKNLFYCAKSDGTSDGLEGYLTYDAALAFTCEDVYNAWIACL